MLDALFSAFQIDQFVIAMIGQFVNEGSAKLTLTTVKALGLVIVGAALDGRGANVVSSRKRRIRRKKKPSGAKAARKKPAARKVRASARG